GRFVAFETSASTLVPGDTNDVRDIFVRDRLMATTERVSISSSGEQAKGVEVPEIAPGLVLGSGNSAISADGRFVVFLSYANNLVPGDTNKQWDVFVRDR